MADERMRLITELINKVSDPLRSMQKDITNFAKTGQDLNKIFAKFGKEVGFNTEATHKHTRETSLLHREMKAFRETIGKVTPQFSELTTAVGEASVGAGSFIGTIAGVGVALYETTKQAGEFAEKMRSLHFVSRETGLTTAHIKQMQIAADEFGMTADQMTGSLNNFKDAMVRVQQRDASFIQSLRPAARYTQEILKLGFTGASTEKQLTALFNAVDKIKKEHQGATGEQMARNFVQLFGVDPALSRLTTEEVKHLLAEISKLGPDPFMLKEAEKDAQQFNSALVKTHAIFEKWRTVLMTGILPPLTHAIELFNKLVTMPGFGTAVGSAVGGSLSLLPGVGTAKRTIGAARLFQDWLENRPASFNERFHFAEGGVVNGPTNALVGEKGPEAIIPLTGGGFDPFTKMQLLLEALFDTDSRYRSVALAMNPSAGQSYSEYISRRGGAGGGPLFRPGVGPRARGGGGSRSQLTGTEDITGGPQTKGSPHIPSLPETGQYPGGIDRSKWRSQMTDSVIARLASMTKGETGLGPRGDVAKQIVENETLFNRATARGYKNILHDVYHGAGGYYAASSFPSVSQGEITWYKNNILPRVLAGSDLGTQFLGVPPTGNASQMGFAGRRLAQGYYAKGRWWGDHPGVNEMFVLERGDVGGVKRNLQRIPTDVSTAGDDRAALAKSDKMRVEGTGQLNVTVNAPPSTKVDASGAGIFQKTNLQRAVQMAPTPAGPAEAATFSERFGNW